MTDITKLKQLEAVRRVFVANVSHELKTPITSIAGYIETALDDIPSDTKNDFLRKSLNQTTRLNSIIDDLLRLSRIEALEDENTFSLLKQNLLAVIDGSIEDVSASLKKFNKKIIIEAELFSIDGKNRFYAKSEKDLSLATELGKEIGQILKDRSKGSYKN